MTNIEKLYAIATSPCLAVGICSLIVQILSIELNCSLLLNVLTLDSPPNTNMLSSIAVAANPPLSEIMSSIISHSSSLILYISLLFKFDPNWTLPPTTKILSPMIPDARCSLAVGIASFSIHVPFSMSYISLIVVGPKLVIPPIAKI